MTRFIQSLLVLGVLLGPARPWEASAQTPGNSTSPSTQLPEVLVTGSNAEPQKSDLSPAAAANPASVSVVKYPEEEKRDIQSYADLFRPITGISVSNFGQGGLGYGITVRGWPEGDHGHDIAYFVNVNELAHTNAPGSKKRKRHEEAQDLLNAGINVISTVNIEHLESLYNSVEQATGVVVRERVPDEVVMSADQIVTIDLPGGVTGAFAGREDLSIGAGAVGDAKCFSPKRISRACAR